MLFLRKSTFPCSNNEHVKSILDFFVSLFSLLFEKTESNVNNEDNTVEWDLGDWVLEGTGFW